MSGLNFRVSAIFCCVEEFLNGNSCYLLRSERWLVSMDLWPYWNRDVEWLDYTWQLAFGKQNSTVVSNMHVMRALC